MLMKTWAPFQHLVHAEVLGLITLMGKRIWHFRNQSMRRMLFIMTYVLNWFYSKFRRVFVVDKGRRWIEF